MNKQTILTGIRSNNDLQVGNYFGALLPLIEMTKKHSEKYYINLMMADLHSFNVPIDYSALKDQIQNNLRIYIAAGLPLDIEDVRIFRQSYVPAHSELAYILGCFTGVGELSRMTEYKDKSAKIGDDRVSVGLFNYPPLMAADILLYSTTLVPVGDDQRQHLEYTRAMAERINTKFEDETILTIPLTMQKQHEFFGKEQGLRIKDLQTPTKKMSKSDESGKGVIFLGDDPDVAARKIMSATTDSVSEIHYDPENQPGISNLLQLLALISGSTLKEVTAQYEGQTQYGPLKKDLAERMRAFLTDFQIRLNSVDQKQLDAKLESSEAQMNITANKTLLRVQKAIGIR